jgi:sulfatase-like protein
MKITGFPYYIFLLPFFFVLHTTTTHWLFIDTGTLLLLIINYCLAAGITFFIFLLLLKRKSKAGLMTFVLLAINFFFSEIHQTLRTYFPVPFIYRYVFIVPFLLLLISFIFLKLYRSSSYFRRLTLYLNILFIIFILGEFVTILVRTATAERRKVTLANEAVFSVCQTCPKPDIYFLVFDEYSSSLSLKQDYNYDNRYLDTFLTEKGFKILQRSLSNYNVTSFSLASITNMSYLRISDPGAITSIDNAEAVNLIGNSRLFDFLTKMGYAIENCSLFDIGDKKAPLHYYFSKTSKEIIIDKTFINTLRGEIGWNFVKKENLFIPLQKKYSESFNNINEGIEKVKALTLNKIKTPRFVYGHFLLPHSPYYMNKMTPYTTEQLAETHSSSVSAYLNYLYYTNTIIKDLINTIQKNTNGESVIIIMGDHGFRPPVQTAFPEKYFKNQDAVFFPGRNYELLYDSINGVNQFRVILNTLFQQKLQLLENKQYYLEDRK